MGKRRIARRPAFGPFDPVEADALERRLVDWCETPALTAELDIPEITQVVLPLLIERRLQSGSEGASPPEEKGTV